MPTPLQIRNTIPLMGLGTAPFVAGITELGSGAYAWLAPDGSWGWSNAGLITDGGESLVVDTLFDGDILFIEGTPLCGKGQSTRG